MVTTLFFKSSPKILIKDKIIILKLIVLNIFPPLSFIKKTNTFF